MHSHTFIPLLCRTYSITAHTDILLITRGWTQPWQKSVHVPGDQHSDISLHWARLGPICSDVSGQQPRSSWLLYVSTKGVEKSFWYGYLVKEIKRFPFALILFRFPVYELILKTPHPLGVQAHSSRNRHLGCTSYWGNCRREMAKV